MQPGPYKEVFLNIYFLKHKVSINSHRRLWGHDLPPQCSAQRSERFSLCEWSCPPNTSTTE